MSRRKVIYISDQKFYIDKDNNWYTTSSFPEGILDVFEDLDEWVFFGRLYKTDDIENLYKFNFNSKVKITFNGVWESLPGIKGYAGNFIYYLKLLYENIKSSDIVYLKFSFITSYLSFFVSTFRNKVMISHMVGDIDCIKFIKSSVAIDMLVSIQKIIYKQIVKKADIQLYVSEDLKRKYASGKAMSVVICENRFSKENIISLQKINEKKEDENFKLLFVGRLSPEKGIADVIESLNKVSNVTLDIIGTGDYINILKTYIAEKGLTERVNFLGYKKWGEELFGSFLDYHSLVLPSYSEGLPLVILEAMSMGLPVIASKVGGIPEIITNGENGLLFKPGRVDEIVDSINIIKFDEGLRQSFITNGLKTAHKYSLENQLEILKVSIDSIRGNVS